jgi:MoxR-like ATPase
MAQSSDRVVLRNKEEMSFVTTRDQVQELKARMGSAIIGQEHVVERLLLGLLTNSNLLVEGLPGLAKTRAIKSLAKNLDAKLSRIQFTPDLLPSDVTGTEIYYQDGGKGEFRFQPGPIFGNLILADEINRAPAKVQAALLEAMEERQITVAGTTHKLPELFMVMATQNPIEQEGTYPLPEAQMDRFLMKVLIEYPDADAEVEVVRLVRKEESGHESAKAVEAEEPIPPQAVFDARREIHAIHVSEAIEKYIVDIINATRYPSKYSDELASWIDIGASPRGALGLDRASRAHAWLYGQDHVTPDNVRAVAQDVLRHRIARSYEASAQKVPADKIVDEIVRHVAVA